MNVKNDYSHILNLFVRLVGYLNLILLYESYKEDRDKFKDILKYINKWSVMYEKERTLKYINNDDLIGIYKIDDDLQTKYICNDNMGSESE